MNTVHFSANDQTWQTPRQLFNDVQEKYSLNLDVAASAFNTMLPRYYTIEQDGLAQSWRGERVWCNPPYGKGMGAWIKKLAEEDTEIAVGFIPARTDTRWFHEYVLYRAEINFIKGRVKFVGARSNAPFPSMICVWRR